MDNRPNQNDPSADKPSFFGKPASWRKWSQVGRQFWFGVIVGLGLGLLVGAVLVEQEWLTLQRKAWVSVAGSLLAFVGIALLFGSGKQPPQQ